MKHLFAPWRMAHIKGPDAPACIFCDLPTRGLDRMREVTDRYAVGGVG